MITEDEQFALVKVSRVLGLIEDLLLTQDRRHAGAGIDPAGLQSLLAMLQQALHPLVLATHEDSWRFLASLQAPPVPLMVDAVRAASGQIDRAEAESTLAALQRTSGFHPVADALRGALPPAATGWPAWRDAAPVP